MEQDIDPREFKSTYFVLRIGMIAGALLVLLAPVLQLVFNRQLPSSISGSWYTSSQAVFVIGLTAASGLLIVIRGDTLTEQTLLNLAGWLGLVVASVACHPDSPDAGTATYPAWAAEQSLMALVAQVCVAGVLLAASLKLPAELFGTGWNVTGLLRTLLRGLPIVCWLVAVAALLWARDWITQEAHNPAAITMFVILAAIALLRTTWGVRLLTRLGDTPVDDAPQSTRRAAWTGDWNTSPGRTFDLIYAGVGVAMPLTLLVGVAGFSQLLPMPDGWLLWLEATLLTLFGVFWATQTIEAWKMNLFAGK